MQGPFLSLGDGGGVGMFHRQTPLKMQSTRTKSTVLKDKRVIYSVAVHRCATQGHVGGGERQAPGKSLAQIYQAFLMVFKTHRTVGWAGPDRGSSQQHCPPITYPGLGLGEPRQHQVHSR